MFLVNSLSSFAPGLFQQVDKFQSCHQRCAKSRASNSSKEHHLQNVRLGLPSGKVDLLGLLRDEPLLVYMHFIFGQTEHIGPIVQPLQTFCCIEEMDQLIFLS